MYYLYFECKIFNNDDSISCRMSPTLWSQMSIVTTFLDHVIVYYTFDHLIPSWHPSTVDIMIPMYRPYKVNVGPYC